MEISSEVIDVLHCVILKSDGDVLRLHLVNAELMIVLLMVRLFQKLIYFELAVVD